MNENKKCVTDLICSMIEDIKTDVCDLICKWPLMLKTQYPSDSDKQQEEFDEKCKRCPLCRL